LLGSGAAAAAAAAAASTAISDEYTSLDRRMTVDRNVVDELLLVCGVIGTETENNEIVPVTDCLNWLQDLQRALRRDDDLYRPISLLLGDWKVVQQKLLPLVLSCRYDTSMVLTVCKILVILTKPLSDNTVRAGRMVIDTKKPQEYVLFDAGAVFAGGDANDRARACVFRFFTDRSVRFLLFSSSSSLLVDMLFVAS